LNKGSVSVVIEKVFGHVHRRVLLGAGAALALSFIAGAWWLTSGQALPMPPRIEPLTEAVTVTALDNALAQEGMTTLPWVAAGRFVALDGGRGLRHEWPGLAVQARFSGSTVMVDFDDAVNRFRLLADGKPVALVTRPGRTRVRLDGLGPGEHLLQVEKVSESWIHGDILGLSVPSGQQPLDPPKLPERRIDIYGDSDTVGYGNLSDGRICPGNNVFLLTDTTRSWPALLTAHYAALPRLTARSGIGLVRNYGGALPGLTMATVWNRPVPSDAALAADVPASPAWITIVALGDNDFATPLGEDEVWPDTDALAKDFADRLADFLTALLDRSPGAPILVVVFEDAGVEAHPMLRDVTDRLAATGAPVRLVFQPRFEREACDWHPTLADHEALTATLVRAIDALIADGLLEAQ